MPIIQPCLLHGFSMLVWALGIYGRAEKIWNLPHGMHCLLEGDWDKSNQTRGTASAKALGWREHSHGKCWKGSSRAQPASLTLPGLCPPDFNCFLFL